MSSNNLNQLQSPVEAFYQRIQHDPEQLCFVQPLADQRTDKFNWSRVNHEVRCMAAYLQSLQLPAQSHIALFSKNCAHWMMADMAIWLAGHISVPLYPILSADTIQQILQHSDCRGIFIGKLDNWESMQAGIDDQLFKISFPYSPEAVVKRCPEWDNIIASHSPLIGNPKPKLDDLATIIYTSGTTGAPKGVMHSFRTIGMAALLGTNIYSVNQNDRVLSYLPLAHVVERSTVEIGQLYIGFTIYFAHSLDTFPEDLRRAKPTLFLAVPRIWEKLQQIVTDKLPPKLFNFLIKTPVIAYLFKRKLLVTMGLGKVRLALSGAAPLSTSTIQWYQQLGLNILEGYGMSENFAYSHSSRNCNAKPGYVGEANPGVECQISSTGEVLIRTPTNMLGYYKAEQATREVLDEEGFLHTGDTGEIDELGRLKITGRIKELFKTSKGKYVAPAPIENRLVSNPYIDQACVTGATLGQPIALINLSVSATKKLTKNDFRQQLQQQLEALLQTANNAADKHERLSCLVVVPEVWGPDNGFTTPTLKIKRAFIDQYYHEHYNTWANAGSAVVFH